MTERVLHNQSILDMAIQHTGTVENSFSIAIANGISISDALDSGLSLHIPETLQKNADMYNYYTAKEIKPATCVIDTIITTLKGIVYIKIGGDFKLS
jgi:hypothetical protein